MSVMGFQKKVWMEGGWVGLAPSSFVFVIFWNCFNFANPLIITMPVLFLY